LVSIKLHNPGFLDGIPWLTFGRMRPVHVNGVIFGSFSTVFLGMLYYIVPRLCGVRMYKRRVGLVVVVALECAPDPFLRIPADGLQHGASRRLNLNGR
jgi:cbb3-type cytochrome oxidase subunit 1